MNNIYTPAAPKYQHECFVETIEDEYANEGRFEIEYSYYRFDGTNHVVELKVRPKNVPSDFSYRYLGESIQEAINFVERGHTTFETKMQLP